MAGLLGVVMGCDSPSTSGLACVLDLGQFCLHSWIQASWDSRGYSSWYVLGACSVPHLSGQCWGYSIAKAVLHLPSRGSQSRNNRPVVRQ